MRQKEKRPGRGRLISRFLSVLGGAALVILLFYLYLILTR